MKVQEVWRRCERDADIYRSGFAGDCVACARVGGLARLVMRRSEVHATRLPAARLQQHQHMWLASRLIARAGATRTDGNHPLLGGAVEVPRTLVWEAYIGNATSGGGIVREDNPNDDS